MSTPTAFTGSIYIYPNTSEEFSIEIPADTSVYSNDGYIGYGKTIVDVDCQLYTSDGTNCTSAIKVGTESVANNIVTIELQYPTDYGVGQYSLRIKYTDSDGNTGEVPLFPNIFVRSNQPS